MSLNSLTKLALSLAVVAFIGGCAAMGGPQEKTGEEMEEGMLPDEFRIPSSIEVPPNTIVITEQSSVSGVSEPTTGFVVMRSKNSPLAILNYFRDNMSRDGWEPAGISQGHKYYISFIRKEPTGGTRVASVRIVPFANSLGFGGGGYSSEMELFVSEAAPR